MTKLILKMEIMSEELAEIVKNDAEIMAGKTEIEL